MTWAQRPKSRGPICPRCNQNEKMAEVIIQARSTKRPKPGAFATRARRMCESCAREVFGLMEDVLDSNEGDNV